MGNRVNGNRQKLVLGVTLVVLVSLVAGVCACVERPKPPEPPEVYRASGRVVTRKGEGIANVLLHIARLGEPGFEVATSDSNGQWSKDGLQGTVIIRPAKEGWEFSPKQVIVTGATTGIKFTGTFVNPVVLAGYYTMCGEFWLPDEEEPKLFAFEGSFTLHVGPGDLPGEFEFYKTALEGWSKGFLLDHPELGLIETGPISLKLDPEVVPQGSYNLATWQFAMSTPLRVMMKELVPEPFRAIAFEQGDLNPAQDHYTSSGYIEVLSGPLAGMVIPFCKCDADYCFKVCQPQLISIGYGNLVTAVSCAPAGICDCWIDNRAGWGGIQVHGRKKGTVTVTITYVDAEGRERTIRRTIHFK